ncbi:hypothetical protein MW887_008283 [Aspergillus wentii]|nr:hypothetical protein MW887_008283 [Aspergillus wentii]
MSHSRVPSPYVVLWPILLVNSSSHLRIYIDSRRQGSRFPQPYPSSYFQPFRQRPSLPIGCRLQDPLRQRRHRSHP